MVKRRYHCIVANIGQFILHFFNMKILLQIVVLILFTPSVYAQHPFPYLEDIYDYQWMEEHKITEVIAETYDYDRGRFYLKALSEYNVFKGNRSNKLFRQLQKDGHAIYEIFCRNVDLYHHDLLHKEGLLLEGINFQFTRRHHMFVRMNGPTHYTLDTEPISQSFIDEFKDRYQFKEYQLDSNNKILQTKHYYYNKSVSAFGDKIEEIKKLNHQTEQTIDYTYNQDALVDKIRLEVSVRGNPESAIYHFVIRYDNQQLPIEILEYQGAIEEANLVYKRMYVYQTVL